MQLLLDGQRALEPLSKEALDLLANVLDRLHGVNFQPLAKVQCAVEHGLKPVDRVQALRRLQKALGIGQGGEGHGGVCGLRDALAQDRLKEGVGGLHRLLRHDEGLLLVRKQHVLAEDEQSL